MTWLWTWDAMREAMNARVFLPDGTAPPEGVSGLSIDTRTLQPGEAYFAILGDIHDGHDFTGAAAKAGAALAVVSEEKFDAVKDTGCALLVVDDVLKALERLGIAARARTNAKIIAITGSVGKTTTKEMLRLALASSGSVHAAVASFNNHWGVPLTLARMPADTDFSVIEIGMNHPGEITPLVKMARPHIAIVTIVAAAHLGAFTSIDDIARAKAEIFDGLEDGGVAVLNRDDERFELLTGLALEKGVEKITGFGEHEDAEVRPEKVVLHGSCSCLTASVMHHDLVIKIGAPGRHIVQNALAVLAAVELAGADLARASLALAKFTTGKGRGERHLLRHPDGDIVLIDESYNANPASVRAALATLGSAKPRGRGRRVAVLGDMLELGTQSAELHRSLAEPLVAAGVARVFLVGSEMAALADALPDTIEATYFETTGELAGILPQEIRGCDVVMVKSSLGLKFAVLVDALIRAWSPRTA